MHFIILVRNKKIFLLFYSFFAFFLFPKQVFSLLFFILLFDF
eukprot:UN04271